jgi:hypothetical protein
MMRQQAAGELPKAESDNRSLESTCPHDDDEDSLSTAASSMSDLLAGMYHPWRPARWLRAEALANQVARSSFGEIRREPVVKHKEEADPEPDDAFSRLQDEVLAAQGDSIRSRLEQVWGPGVKLKRAPMSGPAKERFLVAYEETKGKAVLQPTLHGTDANNLNSIYEHGLRIPGENCMKHGANHGRGIYSATLQNASLACGFCTEPRMLVCAVLDDAVDVSPFHCGRFIVCKQSEMVRHVGDAIVAFHPSRITPLLEAFSLCPWTPPAEMRHPVLQRTIRPEASSAPLTSLHTLETLEAKYQTTKARTRRSRRVVASHVGPSRVHASAFLVRRAARRRR